MGSLAPQYVHARRGLLDALQALGPHRAATILVGAQAVYLRSADVPITSSPYTTDADLALNPATLGTEPALQDVMAAAGFQLRTQPGLWYKPDAILIHAEVDLLVPAAVAGPGRRAARLPGHAKQVAMRSPGLEPVLIDNSHLEITALETGDPRTFQLRVAGIAALLIAKAHKLGERVTDAGASPASRVKQKDAGDILRLLLVANHTTRTTLVHLLADELTGPSTRTGIDHLRTLFGHRRSRGVELATAALTDDLPAARVAAIADTQITMLTADLDTT